MPPGQQHPLDHRNGNHDVDQQSAREDLMHDVSPLPQPALPVVIILTGYDDRQIVCSSLHLKLSEYSDTSFRQCNRESRRCDALALIDFGSRATQAGFLLAVIEQSFPSTD